MQTGYGAHPASYSMDSWASFPRGKWGRGIEADHLPPSSAKFKNEWSMSSIPHMPSWCARGQLCCTFTIIVCFYWFLLYFIVLVMSDIRKVWMCVTVVVCRTITCLSSMPQASHQAWCKHFIAVMWKISWLPRKNFVNSCPVNQTLP